MQTEVMEQWEDFVRERYNSEKKETDFRKYDASAPAGVREFYRLNHTLQTHAFVLGKKAQYLKLDRMQMGIWEALEYLNQLVDESDPDTDLSQVQHALQSAEAARKEGKPEWFQVTALIHDLGKVLCIWGEPQWAVVGDTFATGCAFSDKVVYPEFFKENPDSANPLYQSLNGIYEAGCGLDNVHLSWGHDEYLYHVVKHYLPDEALAMIRFHSFYPWHREGAYQHLMNDHDRKMLPWVKEFNPYDLYSKGHEKPDVDVCRPYYERLIAQYFPQKLSW